MVLTLISQSCMVMPGLPSDLSNRMVTCGGRKVPNVYQCKSNNKSFNDDSFKIQAVIDRTFHFFEDPLPANRSNSVADTVDPSARVTSSLATLKTPVRLPVTTLTVAGTAGRGAGGAEAGAEESIAAEAAGAASMAEEGPGCAWRTAGTEGCRLVGGSEGCSLAGGPEGCRLAGG